MGFINMEVHYEMSGPRNSFVIVGISGADPESRSRGSASFLRAIHLQNTRKTQQIFEKFSIFRKFLKNFRGSMFTDLSFQKS